MFDRLADLPAPAGARVREVATLPLPPGAVTVGDPSYGVTLGVTLGGLPPGSLRVFLHVVPEGADHERVARVTAYAGGGPPDRWERVGAAVVDSASVVLADADALDVHWREVGPDRVGVVHLLPKDGVRVARKLQRRFGFEYAPLGHNARVVAPVDEATEAAVAEYVRGLTGHDFPFFYFHVQTNNTRDRVAAAVGGGSLWAEVPLAAAAGAGLFACKTGWGDGTYPVLAGTRGGRPVAVAVDFAADG